MSDVEDFGKEEDSASKWVIPVFGLLVVGALVYLAFTSINSGTGHKKAQQPKIALLPDTAPPPPPPPPPEKKIEPEVKEDKPQPQQEDVPQPDKPPEPETIKMEGAAGDGPSAFSSGSVNKEYEKGEPLIGASGGGGANKMQFTLYASRATKHVQAELAKNKDLKGLDYRLNVRLWLNAGGGVQRVELASSTGDEAQDALLRQALVRIAPMSEQPPPNMPQPVTLRITNRVTG